MRRDPPTVPNDAIERYVRTYGSLLRSSGEIPVRALEESHLFSGSSLHNGARSPTPDVAALAYAAARLPDCMPQVRQIVVGQTHEQFEEAGLDVRTWRKVPTRGRRRPIAWDGAHRLAVFVTSASDIDDLVPIVTAYQIEWNKLHHQLARSGLADRLALPGPLDLGDADLADAVGLDLRGVDTLRDALGADLEQDLRAIVAAPCDLRLQLLGNTWNEYQRAAQRWWYGIEQAYVRPTPPRRRPVYFVSSNTHALPNLLCGFARAHIDELHAHARTADPEHAAALDRARAAGDETEIASLGYWLLRRFVKDPAHRARVQAWDEARSFRSIDSPGGIDVDAQVFELARLDPDALDPRVRVPGVERLRDSDAVIVNIDYPLGMAAYHLLSRLAQGVGEVRGFHVMGKAATLNARVGDVMISSTVHDAHSRNTWMFQNIYRAADLQPWLRRGSVLDAQRAVTVRSAFLQSAELLAAWYEQGYTVLEMEAGPYLSAIAETQSPHRHPDDELVLLEPDIPVGILHYASDTPYSRRQSLLSKSLSYFGVESTYACAIAITRRILETEVRHVAARG